jgi:hypothetical protein
MGVWTKILFVVSSLLIVVASMSASDDDPTPANYKWRVDGYWWFSHPTASFGLRGSNNYLNVNEDFGFGNYSTFTGSIQYRFGWKHHLLLNVTPLSNSRTVTIARTIEFQGQTYDLGAQVSANLRTINIAPGYQYDFIRNGQGFLGIEADVNLLETKGSLTLVGSANGQQVGASSSKSFFAPLPGFGPTFQWYPIHGSNRLSIEGSLRGMSFFGYGNFLASRGSIGVGITRNLNFRAGYELGSRLSIHGSNDQIGVDLTQKGPTAGLEYTFGERPEPAPKPLPSFNEESDWHFDWVPVYLWFTGLKGTVGAAGYQVPVDATFGDIISQLNIGLMTVADVRRKRFGLLTDLFYISLTSDQKGTPIGTSYSGFTANSKTFFLDPEAYFRVLDGDVLSVDALAGFRYWHLNNNLQLLPAALPGVTVGQTQDWVDPLLGARFRLNMRKGFFATLKGDAGGFGVGSQVTYQIYAGVGKEFKRKFSTIVGYRYLDVDYQNGGFVDDTHMSGPIIGLNLHFQ